MKVFGEWNKGWQAIAAEMTDYTKRSFEESTATFEKLLSAKSVEQAIEIQSGFAKRAYDGYMHQMSKIGGMYAELAKEAYKPVEKAMQSGPLDSTCRRGPPLWMAALEWGLGRVKRPGLFSSHLPRMIRQVGSMCFQWTASTPVTFAGSGPAIAKMASDLRCRCPPRRHSGANLAELDENRARD